MAKAKDRRTFLGWDKPVVDLVVERLVEGQDIGPGKALDLDGTLIVVPTRQAGRHLRQALACWCAERETAALSVQTVTPAFFLRNERDASKEAPSAVTTAVWAKLLLEANIEDYPSLFPAEPPRQDHAWAMSTGDMIERLRRSLADAGIRAVDVPEAAGAELEEIDRWLDISALETEYLKALQGLGYEDSVIKEIERADNPELPDGAERVIVASVPSPTALMLKALESLAERGIPMEVLVQAPADRSDWFDGWGQPLASKWSSALIDIPEFLQRVRVAGTPEEQARIVCEEIAACADRIGPNDIAVGVPDHGVAPFLETHLSSKGLTARDPAETPLSQHALYRLLESFCGLYLTRSYDDFSQLMRHPEVLNFFKQELSLSAYDLLTALDQFQNVHIPMSFEDVEQRFVNSKYKGPGRAKDLEPVGRALGAVQQWFSEFEGGLEPGVRSLLKSIYGARKVIGDSPAEQQLVAAAEAVGDALEECRGAITAVGMDLKQSIALFLQRLAAEKCDPERESALIDLEGWLELPWNKASLMVITGMNEGCVPDSRLGDVFVPDRLRKAIGLPSDDTRFARDVYLLTSMIESRRQGGQLSLVVGKQSAVGDPLKPSRLLFRCADEELLARTEHLLGGVEEPQKNFAFSRSFMLDPAAPLDIPLKNALPSHISATQFSSYIACPFRFYMMNILGMDELDDEQAGLDAADFGSMIHSVLEVLGREDELRACSDVKRLTRVLHGELEGWVRERFGSHPPLTVQLSMASAAQRLTHAAQIQSELVKEGWVIHEKPEARAATVIEGFNVSGRVDRIDRNTKTGQFRIVDYKSGRPYKPSSSHIGSPGKSTAEIAKFKMVVKDKEKECAWKDLQLPLYSHMVRQSHNTEELVGACYFNLPSSVAQTGVLAWDDLNDEVIEEALLCAGRVIRAIKNMEFWPPADKAPFDRFEGLYATGLLAENVDGEAFQKFLKKSREE